MAARVCKPSVKAEWLWNKMFQDLYDKAKKIIKQDACMKF